MSFHNGSSHMAHNLDRFGINSDFEDVAGEAVRLNVSPHTVRMYVDWYGAEPVTVTTRAGLTSMPAYELYLRRDELGERVRRWQQLELAFPAPRNHYAYELRGW
jgi:hypothetical protein